MFPSGFYKGCDMEVTNVFKEAIKALSDKEIDNLLMTFKRHKVAQPMIDVVQNEIIDRVILEQDNEI